MCVVIDRRESENRTLSFQGVGHSDCPVLSENDERCGYYTWYTDENSTRRCYETGFHKFEPYENEFTKMLKVNELIRDLEKLIDDIKEWRAFQK